MNKILSSLVGAFLTSIAMFVLAVFGQAGLFLCGEGIPDEVFYISLFTHAIISFCVGLPSFFIGILVLEHAEKKAKSNVKNIGLLRICAVGFSCIILPLLIGTALSSAFLGVQVVISSNYMLGIALIGIGYLTMPFTLAAFLLYFLHVKQKNN